MNDIEVYDFINALDAVTCYNGLAESILKWKDAPIKGEAPYQSIAIQTSDEQEEIIYMIAVELFGDYGTSPRSGWIEDIDGFYDFIDRITELYCGAKERGEDV